MMNVFVKGHAPNNMLSLKHVLTIILKHQKWLSSNVKKRVTKIKLSIMPKPHAHLQIMSKRPAKFLVDWYKTVRGAAHTRFVPMVMNIISIYCLC